MQGRCMTAHRLEGVRIHASSGSGPSLTPTPGSSSSSSSSSPNSSSGSDSPPLVAPSNDEQRRDNFLTRVMKPLQDFGFGRASFWEGGVGMFVFAGIGTSADTFQYL